MDSLVRIKRNVNASAVNMEKRTFNRRNDNTFLSSLVEFCVDSVSTCFSHEADKLCVPIGLSVLSALLLLLSCFLLVCQRCKLRREKPAETITFLYSILGNLCSTVGAILSRQLNIQILLGAVAVVVDVIHFISCCLPVLLCWNSKAERRLRMMRRRRRQHLLAVCVLMVVAGGFLKSTETQNPADRPPSERRLLHITIQDHTEILGYILGLLSFVIACTSRFPALRRVCRGQMLTRAFMRSGLLCSLAGALYAAAILLYDTHFGFLLRVMPWLLSAVCCIVLDLLILVIHWCKSITRQQHTSFSPDAQSLLDGSHIPSEERAVMKGQRKQQAYSSARAKIKSAQKMTEMGHYMDVSVQPSRKTCLEMTPKDQAQDQLLNGKVQVNGVDSFCSSDTSYDSSLESSDLEWDFEEANARWSEPTAKQQFRPQGWLTNPKPINICTCAISGLSKKTLTGSELSESVSSASFSK